MKLTRILTKKLTSFWLFSLGAVAFVFLLTAFISFIQLTYTFQQQKVTELHHVVIEHYQDDNLEQLSMWLKPMMEAFHAGEFTLTENGKVLMAINTRGDKTVSGLRNYRFEVDAQKHVYMDITLPQPFSQHQLSLYEMLTLLVGLSAIAIFVRYGYLWIAKEVNGIEVLATRSHLILNGEYQAAGTTDFKDGKPLLINRALSKLLDDLDDAKKERGRFDKFIRANTFLDPETQMGNRLFFENRLDALSHDQEMIAHGILLLIEYDIDAKSASVAEVMKATAEAVNKLIETLPDSFIARRHQQQLAVVVPQLSLAEADVLANKILKHCLTLASDNVTEKDNYLHIGAAFYKLADMTTQVVDEAEMALKAAQLQRVNTWFMYDKGVLDSEIAKGSVRWRSFLENALVAKRFYPVAHAIVDSDDKPLAQEILSRVKDNNGNDIRATLFIPMANKCGLMPQIERQLLTHVMQKMMLQNEQVYSINLSADALTSRAFVRWLQSTLLEHRPLAARLIFEVSEDIVVKHKRQPMLMKTLKMIRKMGAKLCVDHVGQQVVGTHYIQEFDFDLVKLHRSIVHNIHQRSENQLFIRSLIGGLYRAKVHVLAEGVGSIEEWQTLKILGVSAGQGAFFSQGIVNISTKKSPA
ncbi:RNase E specificity factor CsrD [Shewanella intestini]|uniref:RNase E specificity factor CsrD n=1 Tax=Shewanella intestini TaxID=2017544 RepID=A0ABS5I4W8_9GAMM|nr:MULTISPECIES: RNase E specificity factor CsrD [Shewanella]MBR9729073.1 RNase E specificity factor CsrD [Shewanella intestini]MRG37149.1 RNase E specificity factor CsrD [Shewanella sp. XMDDZSB0408]